MRAGLHDNENYLDPPTPATEWPEPFGRAARDVKGVAAIEFAMIVPLLSLMVVSVRISGCRPSEDAGDMPRRQGPSMPS